MGETPGGIAHVLLVEDSADDAELLEYLLRSAGFQFTLERVDSAAALKAALARRLPTLVLCDFNLPGYDAGDAIDLILGTSPSTPVLMLSHGMRPPDLVGLLARGARAGLHKDQQAQILAAVRPYLAPGG